MKGLNSSGAAVTATSGGTASEVLVSSSSLLPRPPQPVLPRTSKQVQRNLERRSRHSAIREREVGYAIYLFISVTAVELYL